MRPGPHVEPVRVGRAEHRAEVVVADREGPGQLPLEWDVRLREVPHRERPLGLYPPVHRTVVPGQVLGRPGVVGAGRGLRAGSPGVEVERAQVALGVARVRLPEHRAAARQPDRGRVGEAPDPGHRAEVMVEAAILLHRDDDVLDVAERAAGRIGERGGERPAQAGGQHRRPGGHPDSAVALVSRRRRVSSGRAEAGACGVSAGPSGVVAPRPALGRAGPGTSRGRRWPGRAGTRRRSEGATARPAQPARR